ncbi:threonine--tRNA ligase [Saccharibacillus sp. CPCC 101409]|uniref:threonine--tRNA ligase n=1 Tax=Saccharibacillus sp. CPCC 101409 TaxID=3058041 RepID=UPI0026715667|nr:threonine--tRNA ligase [Saccharibacillus sp. CPCC 101409]MDO3409476.1 threonine--tRNA ligase [Saccharibacillus sp. CPCC 101409]
MFRFSVPDDLNSGGFAAPADGRIAVTLPDGSVKRVPAGASALEIARSVNLSLGKNAVAARLDGRLVDLSTPVCADAELGILLPDDADSLPVLRLSAAHLLAQAVKRLYGEAAVKLGIGLATADGFYYDFDTPNAIRSEDLPAIEREMRRIAAENLSIRRRAASREEALAHFQERGEAYKVEMIEDAPESESFSLYDQGEFTDLDRGPHLPSTGRLKAFKLLSAAGAYWRGDSDKPVLQRIYGTAFARKEQLDGHLVMLEEAKKRDHRKLGRELKLFMFSDEAPGMPFYLPNGMTLRTELESFSRGAQLRGGYREVRSPFMMNRRLWEESGHWDHYKDNMYFSEVDDEAFALKPMNCPGHMLMYKNELRSYRDLPIRLMEFGQVHRHEYSGALSGMMRVRTFCQDDAHLFVRPGQIAEEIGGVMDLIDEMYRVFGFDYRLELSTRPADSMGSDELWTEAENALRGVLEDRGAAYRLNEGDGAFYGPKIDYHVLDALGRSWQCGTIQLDFQMPEKFDLTYIGEDGAKHRPVVIHRAIYGSIDRFLGILTEHYAGAFPLWLAPVQVRVLPVSAHYDDYAYDVRKRLRGAGLRAEADVSGNKLGYKMRTAQQEKVPYIFVVGEKEKLADSVNVRRYDDGQQVPAGLEEMIGELLETVRKRER